jgi:flagellar protein FliO/FliZ
VPAEPEGLSSLALTIGAIAVLLGAAVWAVRRLGAGIGAGVRDCAVLRALVLGPRERLLVVRVGDKQLVLGVGAAAVSLLCELDEKLPPPVANDRFGVALGKAMGRWRGA